MVIPSQTMPWKQNKSKPSVLNNFAQGITAVRKTGKSYITGKVLNCNPSLFGYAFFFNKDEKDKLVVMINNKLRMHSILSVLALHYCTLPCIDL